MERPFLRSASPRRQPRQRWATALCLGLVAATATVVGVRLSEVSTRDPLVEVIHAGDKALEAQHAPPSTTTTTATSLPVETTPPTLIPSPTPDQAVAPDAAPEPVSETTAEAVAPAPEPVPAALPPSGVPVTAIGDSVMVTSADALLARLGDTGYIDAKQNRHFSDGAQVVRDLRQQGRLGQVVIVHLGNNGPVAASHVDDLMYELSDVSHVLLVTVRVNRPWEGSVNQTLLDGATRYPTIHVVDWYSYSAGQDGWFQGDGTHFKTTSGPGANAYADLLVGSIPAL